jgi:hypothetical protein
VYRSKSNRNPRLVGCSARHARTRDEGRFLGPTTLSRVGSGTVE